MSGSPALGGTQPTSTGGLAEQIAGHGITNNQPGINQLTAGNTYNRGLGLYHQLCKLKWINTKGSKLEYGLSVRVDVVLGMKHLVVGGFKTSLDIAWNRTYDSRSYSSLNAGFKYEAIVGRKQETVHDDKDDDVWGAKEISRANGVWTSSKGVRLAKRQATFKEAVDRLLQEFDKTLEETTTKAEAEIDTFDLKADKLRQACSAKIDESCKVMEESIKTLKENITKMETSCKNFEMKAADIDNAADSALKIRTPSSKIAGSMIEIKATVQKFLADLVKLGE